MAVPGTSLTDQDVRVFLGRAIEAGEYPVGSRLPAERALCEMLSASRSAVRSGLARMEGEGLIVRRPGSGAYVSDRTGVASSGLDSASPAKIMEARLTIEPPMAILVARNATAADFSAMDRCVVAGRAATSLESFEHWDASLHEAIASATGNPLVAAAYRLVTRARETSEWGALKRKSLTPAARAAYQADHERIVEALRQRDVDAASEALRSHLIDIRKNLLGE